MPKVVGETELNAIHSQSLSSLYRVRCSFVEYASDVHIHLNPHIISHHYLFFYNISSEIENASDIANTFGVQNKIASSPPTT